MRANTRIYLLFLTNKPEIPISTKMEQIISKYRGLSPYGYIFPIIDDKQDKLHKVYLYQMKKFREGLNLWLFDVGKRLG
jgi:hypothetical protein